jgi:hypothetical protein
MPPLNPLRSRQQHLICLKLNNRTNGEVPNAQSCRDETHKSQVHRTMDAMSIMSATPTVVSDEITLIFENDNPCDTIITDSETGEIAYIISTKTVDGKIFTYFEAVDREVLAFLEWQPGVDEDLISLGQLSSVPFKSYFRKSMFKESVQLLCLRHDLN